MLVAGIDMSGDQSIGNCKFMGIVIGHKEKTDYLVRNIGNTNLHMRTIKSNMERKRIISKINFDKKNIIAFCFLINQDFIINKFRQKRSIKRKNISQGKILRICNSSVMHHIQKQIEEFLVKNNYTVYDVVFQCDSDCRNILKENGLKYGEIGSAHMEPDGVISIDLTSQIEFELKKAQVKSSVLT